MRLTDVSHVVKSLEFRDGAVHASIEALDTYEGRALKAMLSGHGQRPVRFVPEGHIVSKNEDGAITELKLTSVGVRDPDPGEKL